MARRPYQLDPEPYTRLLRNVVDKKVGGTERDPQGEDGDDRRLARRLFDVD